MNAVEFNNVSRSFKLQVERRNSFQERMVSLFRPRGSAEIFWALRDVSFEVPRGTTLGLIGHNGSGKSTTLKLVSRILEPTSGTVAVRGRVSALLELGSGFHPDLTGRDNIYLNGSLLGFNRADMRARIDEVIDFAGLGPFIDTPVKHFSSGMYMRLGFAIATSVDPDILITDEVLAVGDETFQRKCMNRIHQFREEGRTILFVSHSLMAVRNLCSQAVWLDHGRVQAAGDTQATIDAYLRWANERDQERIEHERAQEAEQAGEELTEPFENDPQRWGTRDVEITRVEFLDSRGRPRDVFQTGSPLTIRMHYRANRRVQDPVFGLAIYHRSGFQLNGPNSRFAGYPIPHLRGEGYVDYSVDELPLLAGEYLISASVYDAEMLIAYDHRDRQFLLTVHSDTIAERFGIIAIPSRWRWHEETQSVERRAQRV
jgi:ABC-type polysaccharide/polyol phosphate transport system ATPase subunit